MLLLVMCELNSPAALAPIRETVEGFGPARQFYDSFFVVSTNKSPEDLKRALYPLVNEQGIIFVSQIKQAYVGYLPRDIRDWVAAQCNLDTIN